MSDDATLMIPEVPEAEKLEQTVEVTDAGPCKKHVKVVVARPAIDKRFEEKYTSLTRNRDQQLPGFRPGKAPRKVIERRFKSTVRDEVRTEVLYASLEQLATENKIAPLAPPDLNPDTLSIPDTGDFVYEFDVEVRPEFDLPQYKGMKLRRPVKEISPQDVEREQRRLLEPYGTPEKKGEGQAAEMNDRIIADVAIKHDGKPLNSLQNVSFRVDKQLVLNDGVARDFSKAILGARVGDTRLVQIQLSQDLGDPALRGATVDADFTVKAIYVTKLPELTEDVLENFGVKTAEGFNEVVHRLLELRLQYTQRQWAKEQILSHINEAATWDLPNDLLRRQAVRTLRNKIQEMRSSGMSDEQIAARRKLLEQDSMRSTALALKEQFVLHKIAEEEKLEVSDDDISMEVERIASQSNESVRKVRARLEKDDLIEAIGQDLIERKALGVILESAEYEDVPLPGDTDSESASTVSDESIAGDQPPAPAAEPLN